MELLAIVRAVLMFFARISGRVHRVSVQSAAHHLVALVAFTFFELPPRYFEDHKSNTWLSIRCGNLRVIWLINASETTSLKVARPY